MLNGAVRPNLNAPTTYGEDRPSWFNGRCNDCRLWYRLGRVSNSVRLATSLNRPSDSVASGNSSRVSEKFADLIGVAVKDIEDLGLNQVEVRDAATTEDYRDAGQRPFDGGVGRGVHQSDGVAVLQRLR